MAAALNIPILIGAAVVDSINPCAFGVLVFLLAYLARTFKHTQRMLIHGLVYITAVFLTYLAAGLMLLPVIRELGNIASTAYILIGIFVILMGLLEIKDAFWFGRGPTLAIWPSAAKRIEMYGSHISQKLSTAFFLGVFVALVELPCTGAVYIAVLTLMSLAGLTLSNLTLLLLYNLVFILPLVVILFVAHHGMSTERLEAWRNRHKKWMRLALGVTLVSLGVWMILYLF